MKLRKFAFSVAALGAVTAVACVTVNIYFPENEIREAAEEIVEETWGEQEGALLRRSRYSAVAVLQAVVSVLAPTEAHAGGPDINVTTAAIRALKADMRVRSLKLKPYLRAGRIALRSNGLLESRDLEGLPLQEKALVRKLLDAENRDRGSLYREITSANNLPAERVADVQAIFAEAWLRKAEAGWWVQAADGSWSQR